MAIKKKRKKTGRKTKYDPSICELVGYWARDGLIDKEIAKRLGISESTLYKWKNEFSEFSESIQVNKEIIDYRVESALLKRAMGYEFTDEETNIEEVVENGTKRVKKRIHQIKKHIPGDVTAQSRWLANRQPHKWREKKEIDIKTKVDLELNDVKASFTDFEKELGESDAKSE